MAFRRAVKASARAMTAVRAVAARMGRSIVVVLCVLSVFSDN
jgi:hypothetical protein